MADHGRVFEHGGKIWLRVGECNHCGACCRGCPLHNNVAGRCDDYSGVTYLAQGCDTWPSDPVTVAQFPECGYRFLPLLDEVN